MTLTGLRSEHCCASKPARCVFKRSLFSASTLNLLPQPSHTGVREVATLGSTCHTPACNQLVASSLLTHLRVIGHHPQYETPPPRPLSALLSAHPVCIVCVICRKLFSPIVSVSSVPSPQATITTLMPTAIHTSALRPHWLHSQLSSLFITSYPLCSDRQLLLEPTMLPRHPL